MRSIFSSSPRTRFLSQAASLRAGLLLSLLGAALLVPSAPLFAQDDAAPADAPAAPADADAMTGDWAMYKGDAQRTSARSIALPLPLNLLWRYSSTASVGNASAPVVVGEGQGRRVFFSAGATVFCIDGETGSEVWKSQVLPTSVTTPLLYVPGQGGGMIIAVSGGQISALRTSDGGQIWMADAKSPIALSAPVVARTEGGDRLIVSLATGPLLAYTLAGAPDPKWRINALNAQARVAATATPAISKDGTRMFVPAQDQKLYVVDIAKAKVDFAIPLSAQATASPMVLDDQVIATAGESVMGYRIRTGDPVWRVNTGGGQVSASPAGSVDAAGKPVVYIGARNGTFYAIDATKGGKVLWKTELGEPVTGTASVTKNAIVVGTGRGVMFALKPEDGSVIWQYRLRTERVDPNAANNGRGQNFGRGGVGGGNTGRGNTRGGNTGRGGFGRFTPPPPQIYGVSTPPVIVDGQAFVMGDNVSVYCFDTQAFDSAPPRVLEPSLSVPSQEGALSTQLIQENRPPQVPGKAPIYFAAQVDDTGSGLDPSTLQAQWNNTALPTERVTYAPGTGVLTITLNQKDANGASTNLPDGTYNLQVSGKDYSGNVLTYTARVTINNALPSPSSQQNTQGGRGGRGNRGGRGGGFGGGGDFGGGFGGGGGDFGQGGFGGGGGFGGRRGS